jgi:hypothetical protein
MLTVPHRLTLFYFTAGRTEYIGRRARRPECRKATKLTKIGAHHFRRTNLQPVRAARPSKLEMQGSFDARTAR